MKMKDWDNVRPIESFDREELITIVRRYDRAFIELAETIETQGPELHSDPVLSDLYVYRDMVREWPTHALDELLGLAPAA